MSLGPYASFIAASYLVVLVVVMLLIAWIVIDYRTQKRRLTELESKGITRRSQRRTTD
ncbi:MAG TPA: heme exporter protein CcmD [Bradyrhizobium sp.]|uniref:heme exporter protein CcmD n=1 Tax=Bradyrhizobium sp. TaxID=376 RepID=UPI002D7ED397|nr:heme exporter protein CcmD [Bradyrhizobium sp.]HET7888040.1 heme exporter protein CcmD [Bradyrhizobium sp.]